MIEGPSASVFVIHVSGQTILLLGMFVEYHCGASLIVDLFFHSAKILWNVCCSLDILLLQLAEAGLGGGSGVTPFLCCHPELNILGIFRVFHDNFLGYLEPRIFTSGCNLKKKKINHHCQASAAAPWVRSSIFRVFLFFLKKVVLHAASL